MSSLRIWLEQADHLFKWVLRISSLTPASLQKGSKLPLEPRELQTKRLDPTTQMRWQTTYNALLLRRHDAILDPEAPGAHHICQHHVCAQPVSNDGDLRGVRHARLGVLAEVLHDLVAAAWLLACVRQHRKPRGLLKLGRKCQLLVERCCASRVGDDEKLLSRVCGLQLLEMILEDSQRRGQSWE